jgi:hypothetical protein
MLDIALDQSPIVSHTTEASPALPSLAVGGAGADRSSLLGMTPVTEHERRNCGFNAPPTQMWAESSAVIRLVRDKLPGPCAWATSPLGHLHRRQYRLGQHAFMRLCAIYIQPDEQAIAVGNSHNFRAFAHFGFAYAKAPFFAGTKWPSRNASAHSIFPWASNRLNNACQIRSHVPGLDQAQKRRQQVAGEPSTRGTSSRAHPLFNTQRMPVNVVRSSFRFRPGPGCCMGIKGSNAAHGSAVASCRLMHTV